MSDWTSLVDDLTGVTGDLPPSLWLALHVADPHGCGDQSAFECGYEPYARVAVPRTPEFFVPMDQGVSSARCVEFPAVQRGAERATHFSIGTASDRSSRILFSGPFLPVMRLSPATIPQLISFHVVAPR